MVVIVVIVVPGPTMMIVILSNKCSVRVSGHKADKYVLVVSQGRMKQGRGLVETSISTA